MVADPVPAVTVTNPNGGQWYTPNSAQTATWTTSPIQGPGVYGVWACNTNGTNYWLGSTNVVTGQTGYSLSWTTAVPNGTYRLRVSFGVTAGTWTVTDYSDATFSVADPVPSMTVTSPNGGEIYDQGSDQVATWTTTSIQGPGVYGVWACSNGGTNYWLGSRSVVGGQTTYSLPWTATLPADTYRLRVSFGVTAASWLASDYSDATFAIKGPLPTVAVTSPNGGESLTQGSPQTATWTATPAQYGGVFGVWATSSNGTNYWLGSRSVTSGQTSYTLPWTASLPVGAYRLRVSFGVTAASWVVTDYSDATFLVN
jgi:hypothetical protein